MPFLAFALFVLAFREYLDARRVSCAVLTAAAYACILSMVPWPLAIGGGFVLALSALVGFNVDRIRGLEVDQ